jgi:hypothetical protein
VYVIVVRGIVVVVVFVPTPVSVVVTLCVSRIVGVTK